ncbi:MAG: hypothetical protein V4489_07465 [Chlamydiota bacterium]
MYYEFHNLYRSLFANYTKHVSVVEALGKNRIGMTKGDLLKETGMKSGGGGLL